MRRFFVDNSLAIAAVALFVLVFAGGQTVAGYRVYNEDQQAHAQPAVGFATYLTTAHFGEATFENWESEFLQMGAYVLLTIRLRQRGSAESKDFGPQEVDEDPADHRDDPDAPWPVRRGGVSLAVYKRSLSIAFFALLAAAFLLHAVTGARLYSSEQVEHGSAPVTTWQYLHRSQFWFESLQNWQSEFLAVAAIVILTVFLRQQGSSESKPVHAPNHQTGA